MHRNAPLTPEGRFRLCQLIEDGWTVAAAAESMRISRQTAHKWWRRYREAGQAGLVDRSSRPRRCPTKTPAKVERQAVALRRRLALEWVTELARDLQDTDHPIEARSIGRTLIRWKKEIAAWHRAHVSNGPTEAVTSLVERVKRAAFGFTSWFRNYRVRSLLYASKPNWDLLATVTPR